MDILAAFSDGLQSSEVNDSVERIFFEKRLERCSISDIDIIKIGSIPEDFFYTYERISRAIHEIIDDDGLVSRLLECDDRM